MLEKQDGRGLYGVLGPNLSLNTCQSNSAMGTRYMSGAQ